MKGSFMKGLFMWPGWQTCSTCNSRDELHYT
jgi:hypothetical protein